MSIYSDFCHVLKQYTLPKNKFILVDLNNIPNKELSREIENTKLTEQPFNRELLYKKTPKDLTDKELQKVLAYYNDLDLTEYPLKSRKGYIEKIHELTNELKTRNNND